MTSKTLTFVVVDVRRRLDECDDDERDRDDERDDDALGDVDRRASEARDRTRDIVRRARASRANGRRATTDDAIARGRRFLDDLDF